MRRNAASCQQAISRPFATQLEDIGVGDSRGITHYFEHLHKTYIKGMKKARFRSAESGLILLILNLVAPSGIEPELFALRERF
jgi:hypothetical protein